jgi:hypothetical protein
MLIQRERDICFMSEASSLENYLGAEFWRHPFFIQSINMYEKATEAVKLRGFHSTRIDGFVIRL